MVTLGLYWSLREKNSVWKYRKLFTFFSYILYMFLLLNCSLKLDKTHLDSWQRYNGLFIFHLAFLRHIWKNLPWIPWRYRFKSICLMETNYRTRFICKVSNKLVSRHWYSKYISSEKHRGLFLNLAIFCDYSQYTFEHLSCATLNNVRIV